MNEKVKPEMKEVIPIPHAVRVELALDTATYGDIAEILTNARKKAYSAVNFAMVEAYWLIGKKIVELLGEDDRAEYGTLFMRELSVRLSRDFGKGFTLANLKNMRQFYKAFPIGYALRSQLSWTHYRLIMRVENEKARQFYIEEAVKSQWSSRQLERQILTCFYERLLASQNKEAVAAEIQRTAPGPEPRDFIKNPYVLEFLNIPPSPELYEKDLEGAIIMHLQTFLLEMGRGFSFVARQKRLQLQDDNYYIDLVFYNYILRCFVLIELKIGKLTEQDLGQMQLYVNYYTRELMNEGDNPPIGIILCAEKNDAVVRYTLPENNTQVFASKYKLYLPTEEELKKEIEAELRRNQGENHFRLEETP